jgi:hypothetical protein
MKLAILLVAFVAFIGSAFANEPRVALVIGNSAYDRQPLRNPVNDANAMSARLRSLGFVVIERNNLRIRQIGSTLREFRSQLKPGAVARAQRSEALRSYPDADGYGRRLRHWER